MTGTRDDWRKRRARGLRHAKFMREHPELHHALYAPAGEPVEPERDESAQQRQLGARGNGKRS